MSCQCDTSFLHCRCMLSFLDSSLEEALAGLTGKETVVASGNSVTATRHSFAVSFVISGVAAAWGTVFILFFSYFSRRNHHLMKILISNISLQLFGGLCQYFKNSLQHFYKIVQHQIELSPNYLCDCGSFVCQRLGNVPPAFIPSLKHF